MIKAIREAGRIPVQRDTFYQPVKVWSEETPLAAENAGASEILERNLASA
jgi:2-iminoacetate synthase ThiH